MVPFARLSLVASLLAACAPLPVSGLFTDVPAAGDTDAPSVIVAAVTDAPSVIDAAVTDAPSVIDAAAVDVAVTDVRSPMPPVVDVPPVVVPTPGHPGEREPCAHLRAAAIGRSPVLGSQRLRAARRRHHRGSHPTDAGERAGRRRGGERREGVLLRTARERRSSLLGAQPVWAARG
ncbi:MAG: hypothetical protein IPF99_31075 [Deltaproteobacteria bacterium]|nr:hypothetical protein [Deltaproteobacteria bacterium]